MLRILHVSDTQWTDGSEEKLIADVAKREKIDFIIHTGDLLDRKRKPTSNEAWEIIQNKIRILRESNVPLIIIPGNHDPEGFHGKKSVLEKRQSLTQVINIFQECGAIVPEGTYFSLADGITLSYLNKFSEQDFFYGIAVNNPIKKPSFNQINLAMAHGVGYVPYELVVKRQLDWKEAVFLEQQNTHRRWREILALGYDIILCGHHRHTNVPNGLFRWQGRFISLRGQHRSGDERLDKIADCGTLIEIDQQNISLSTVDFVLGKILNNENIAELEYE